VVRKLREAKGRASRGKRYVVAGLGATLAWFGVAAGSEAMTATALGIENSSASGWHAGLREWVSSGGGAGMGIAICVAAALQAIRRHPNVGHVVGVVAGMLGLFLGGALAHQIVTQGVGQSTSESLTAALLAYAAVAGAIVSFANKWNDLQREDAW
jgi:hypothetical protein